MKPGADVKATAEGQQDTALAGARDGIGALSRCACVPPGGLITTGPAWLHPSPLSRALATVTVDWPCT